MNGEELFPLTDFRAARRHNRGSVGVSIKDDDASSVGAEEITNCRQIFRAIYGGRRAQKYKHVLKFIPWCRFIAPALEQAYADSQLYSFRFRAPVAGVLLSLLTIILWATYAPLLERGKLVVTSDTFVEVVQVMSAACLLTSLALSYSNWFTFGRKHPESWFYLFSWQLYVFWMLWAIAVFIDGYVRRDQLLEVVTIINSLQFKFWTDTTLIFLLFTNLCLLDQLILTRTRISVWFHIIPGALYVGSKILTSITFNDILTKKIIPGVVMTQCLQMIIMIFLIVQSYLGRLNNEGLERVSFYKVLKNQRQLTAIRRAQNSRKRQGGETAIENLTVSLKKAQTAIQAAALKHASDDITLIEQDEALKQCVELSLDTDDLFAIGRPQDPIMGMGGAEYQEDVNWVKVFRIIHEGKIEKLPGNGPMGTTGDDIVEVSLKDQGLYFTPNVLPDEIDNPIPTGDAGVNPKLNLLELSKTRSDILLGVGMDLMEPQLPYMNVSYDCMNKYLFLIQERYYPNPYHNAIHGANVAHMTMLIVRCLDLRNRMSNYDLVALPLAALGHDLGHPGKNNNFMSSTGTLLARMYSDRAVLENFHSYLTFRLAVIGPEVNVFQNLPEEDYRWIRQRVVSFILATDMANHFEKISKFRIRKESPKYDITNNIEDFQNLLRLCIKMGDLSHAVEPWQTHMEWSLRVTHEFYLQGDKEKALGLPISPLCDSSKHHELSKGQAGFLSYVVLPLATELLDEDVTGQFEAVLMARLVYNKHKWEMMKDLQQPEIPPEIKAIRTAPPHFAESTFIHSLFSRTVANIAAEDPMSDPLVCRLFSRKRIAEVFEPHKTQMEILEEELEWEDASSSDEQPQTTRHSAVAPMPPAMTPPGGSLDVLSPGITIPKASTPQPVISPPGVISPKSLKTFKAPQRGPSIGPVALKGKIGSSSSLVKTQVESPKTMTTQSKTDISKKTPPKAESKTPMKAAPKTPLKTEPKTPLKAEPKAPSKAETPLKSEPKAPLKAEQEAPMKTETAMKASIDAEPSIKALTKAAPKTKAPPKADSKLKAPGKAKSNMAKIEPVKQPVAKPGLKRDSSPDAKLTKSAPLKKEPIESLDLPKKEPLDLTKKEPLDLTKKSAASLKVQRDETRGEATKEPVLKADPRKSPLKSKPSKAPSSPSMMKSSPAMVKSPALMKSPAMVKSPALIKSTVGAVTKSPVGPEQVKKEPVMMKKATEEPSKDSPKKKAPMMKPKKKAR